MGLEATLCTAGFTDILIFCPRNVFCMDLRTAIVSLYSGMWLYFGRVQKVEKRDCLDSSCLPLFPSGWTDQFGPIRMEFREIWYVSFRQKCAQKIKFKSDKNNGYFTRIRMYVVGSKSFRPDRLFKVTNKTTLLFFNIVSLYFNTLSNWYINLTIDGTRHYISLTAFSIWRGFCMSGRKLLEPTTYIYENFSVLFFLEL